VTGDEARIVVPILLAGSSGESGIEDPQNCAELAVVDPDKDGAAGVVSACFRPTTNDKRKVMDVEGHHDAPFGRSKRKEILVAPTIQGALFVGCANVMADLPQGVGDAPSGDVSIEKEAHVWWLCRDRVDVDGREMRTECVERPTTFSDRCVDLLWEAIVVGKSQAELCLGQVTLLQHAVKGAEILVRANDLPDIQGRADDPWSALPVGSAEGDAWKKATPQCLIGQSFNNSAFGAPRASGFLSHELIHRRR